MSFKVGQRVVIRKALGERSEYGKGYYFYSGTPQKVPLGTKGKIRSLTKEGNRIYLKFASSRIGDSGEWQVHPDEICLTQEDEREANSILESVVVGEEPKDDGRNGEVKQFEPKFNVREEFAVWVRNEFPELRKHADERKKYNELQKRKNEVLEGARLAYNHALEKTTGCAKTGFVISYYRLTGNTRALEDFRGDVLDVQRGSRVNYTMSEEDREGDKPHFFPLNLFKFVDTIERSSVNLASGVKHYGTRRKT